MNRNKPLWEKRDFTRITASRRDSGRAIVAGLGITRVSRLDTRFDAQEHE